jgi:hypothetical protein
VTIDQCDDPFIEVVSDATVYSWTGQNIPAGQEVTSRIEPTPTTAGVYLYSVNMSDPGVKCPVDSTFTLNFGLDPIPTISQNDACQDQVTLSADPTGSYVYRWTRNGVDFAGGQQVAVTTPDNGASFIVELRNTTTNCTVESAATPIAVLGLLDVEIVNDQPCEGTPYDLTASVRQDPDFYLWEYNGTVQSAETDSVFTVSDNLEGTFKVTVQRSTAGFVCVDSDEVSITVAPVTPGTLTPTGEICPGGSASDPHSNVVLDPGTGFIGYQWYLDGDAIDPPAGTDSTLTATAPGVYSVDLVNVFGCPSSDEIELIEKCDPRIVGPNAFRPGGLNSEFYLLSFYVDDDPFEVYIFNRWGEMIYHSTDRNFRWNGGINNEGPIVPPGTYSYLVKYQGTYRHEEGVKEYRGGVVVMK